MQSIQATHTQSAYLLALSNGFERASYYGVRAVIVIFMVDATLNLSNASALAIYGFFTAGIYASKVIGALLGDLLIGNRRAIWIGGSIQALGCIVLCGQSLTTLYVGLGLIAVGSGLFSPNVIAQFGKQYTDRPKLLDAGFTMLLLVVNIAAAVGVLVVAYMGDFNYNYAFILGALFVLMSIVIAVLTKHKSANIETVTNQKQFISGAIYIIVAALIAGFFWFVYEITYYGIYEIQMRVHEIISFNLPKSFFMNSLSSYFVIFLGIVLTIVWSFIYTNQFFKFFIGLVISGISFLILVFFPENLTTGHFSILLISMFLLALGESLISPLLYSVTTKYSNPKYLAIMLSIVVLPSFFFNKAAGLVGENTLELSFSTIFMFSSITLILAGVVAGGLWWYVREKERQKV